MFIFQSGTQKNAFQQQKAFSMSLHDTEAQSFLKSNNRLPIRVVEDFLKAVNP
jgi:hypothetical protein